MAQAPCLSSRKCWGQWRYMENFLCLEIRKGLPNPGTLICPACWWLDLLIFFCELNPAACQPGCSAPPLILYAQCKYHLFCEMPPFWANTIWECWMYYMELQTLLCIVPSPVWRQGLCPTPDLNGAQCLAWRENSEHKCSVCLNEWMRYWPWAKLTLCFCGGGHFSLSQKSQM